MSEALESRGFGGAEQAPSRSPVGPVTVIGSLTSIAVAAFMIASGHAVSGAILLMVGVAAAVAAVRTLQPADGWRPTRYRPVVFGRSDRWLAFMAAVALVGLLTIDRLSPGALSYEPYPVITAPNVSLAAIAAIALLLSPLLAPAEGRS